MFSTIATTQSIIRMLKAPIISNYWFSFNTTQVSSTTVTCDTKPTATMALSSASAVTTTGMKEGNQCFYGGNRTYSGITSNFPSFVPRTAGITVMCWMKCNTILGSASISSTAYIFSIGSSANTFDGFGIAYSTNQLGAQGYIQTDPTSGNQGSFTTSKITADGNWHHIALTISVAGILTAYIDGTSVNASDISGSVSPNTYDTCTVNAKFSTPSAYGLFNIDSLRIFPSGQTAAQVLSYYNAGN